jgi:hypothetical protein
MNYTGQWLGFKGLPDGSVVVVTFTNQTQYIYIYNMLQGTNGQLVNTLNNTEAVAPGKIKVVFIQANPSELLVYFCFYKMFQGSTGFVIVWDRTSWQITAKKYITDDDLSNAAPVSLYFSNIKGSAYDQDYNVYSGVMANLAQRDYKVVYVEGNELMITNVAVAAPPGEPIDWAYVFTVIGSILLALLLLLLIAYLLYKTYEWIKNYKPAPKQIEVQPLLKKNTKNWNASMQGGSDGPMSTSQIIGSPTSKLGTVNTQTGFQSSDQGKPQGVVSSVGTSNVPSNRTNR